MTIRLTKLFGLIGGLWMVPAALFAAGSPIAVETPSQKADALLEGLIETNDPGFAVLVAQDGKILFEKGYGLADLEHHVPITPQTIFRIASVTKQFTAAAILKLQEERKLSVDDRLSKYIPDFPRGSEVTLRQLLTHTSGIHDCLDEHLIEPDFGSRVTNATTTLAIIEELKKHPYDFDPGTKWSYDNSGYLLLSYIVEKVSGQGYGDFLRENFFQPLGMTNTGVYRVHSGLPHEALGYSLGTNGFNRALNIDSSWLTGNGALYCTVEDLFRWNEGIFNGQVLDKASLKAAFTPIDAKVSQLNSGHGYGFGWFVSRDRGLRDISHGGGMPGFTSMLLRLPDEKLTVAVLVNSWPGGPGAENLAYSMVDIFLEDKLAPLAIVDTNVSPKSYGVLTGRYDLNGEVLTFSTRGTHLFVQTGSDPEVEVFPKSTTEFFWKGGEDHIPLTFVKDSSGKAVKIIFNNYGMEFAAPRASNSAVDPAVYDSLLGKYNYGEDGMLTVTRKGNHLFAQLTGRRKYEIFPKSETDHEMEFFWKVVDAQVTFVTDTTGKVTKAVHHQDGQTIDAPKIQ